MKSPADRMEWPWTVMLFPASNVMTGCTGSAGRAPGRRLLTTDPKVVA
jgi:hypothetical protein